MESTTTAGAAPVYDTEGWYDEALDAEGRPRAAYAELLAALSKAELSVLSARTRQHVIAEGATFGTERGSVPFHVDPVPRLVEREEWALLERGLSQRARALNAFIADVYGARAMVHAGRIPQRALESADHFEPGMLGVHVPGGHAPVIGFDLVRGADGRLAVLEDNSRTPSGIAYCSAARAAVDALPLPPPTGRLPIDPAYELLAASLRAAAPDGHGDPSVALLSDGSSNSAWYEHRVMASRLGIPIVTRRDLHVRSGRLHAALAGGRSPELQVLYRRTDEDELTDNRGRPTWLAEALLDPVRRGRLSVVNAFGSGVADDKLVHAYVEEMVRFFLGEEPLLPSVPTHDLGDPAQRPRAIERVDELVVKPRVGHGGEGVVVCRHATPEDRAGIVRAIRQHPGDFVAQDTIMLSRHPTVCAGRLEPRHVDLRTFAIGDGVLPGGLTRVALGRGSLVVNSSQDGGGKDTWVLP